MSEAQIGEPPVRVTARERSAVAAATVFCAPEDGPERGVCAVAGPGAPPPGFTEDLASSGLAATPGSEVVIDLYRFDFVTGRERKVAGASTDQASEVLPSVWKDKIAFARVYEQRDGLRGVVPYLCVRPLAGGRSERQPGGARGTTGLPRPTSLDLYGRRLSFVWNHATRDAGVSEGR